MALLTDSKVYGDLEVSQELKVGSIPVNDNDGTLELTGNLKTTGTLSVGGYQFVYNTITKTLDLVYVGL